MNYDKENEGVDNVLIRVGKERVSLGVLEEVYGYDEVKKLMSQDRKSVV